MILRVIVNECRVSLFFVAFLFPQHHDAARRQSYAKLARKHKSTVSLYAFFIPEKLFIYSFRGISYWFSKRKEWTVWRLNPSQTIHSCIKVGAFRRAPLLLSVQCDTASRIEPARDWQAARLSNLLASLFSFLGAISSFLLDIFYYHKEIFYYKLCNMC